MVETTRRRVLTALGIGGAGSVAGCSTRAPAAVTPSSNAPTASSPGVTADRVAADPTDLPAPIDREHPRHHDVTLTVEELTVEIEPGVTFDYMTFDGQVPGPMIRVREGDTVSFTLENAPDNDLLHNVDVHAVYGTGGGNVATTAAPGKQNAMEFTATYPGAFIYHCAVQSLDYHISSGMFGMIVVEPEAGLPAVDREFYLGQHEVYTDRDVGTEGHHGFDVDAMADERPTYVLFNGEKYPFTPDRYGTLTAKQGERIRVFLVVGGPNYTSNFHPIGNVWADAYRDGAVASEPERYVQTLAVPPGSCMVGEMDTPVPERVKLVDHALTRVTRRGLLAMIDVRGDERADVFDPSPGKSGDADEEAPIY